MAERGDNPFLTAAGMRRVARLARLEISDGELPALLDRMRRIVAHVDALREIPEAALSAAEDPAATPLREDRAVGGDGMEELGANAARLAHGHAEVPRVVDSE